MICDSDNDRRWGGVAREAVVICKVHVSLDRLWKEIKVKTFFLVSSCVDALLKIILRIEVYLMTNECCTRTEGTSIL